MQCNGKCHLSKELQSTDQGSENNPPIEELLKYEILLFATSTENSLTPRFFFNNKIDFPNLHISIEDGYFSEIFHPPVIG